MGSLLSRILRVSQLWVLVLAGLVPLLAVNAQAQVGPTPPADSASLPAAGPSPSASGAAPNAPSAAPADADLEARKSAAKDRFLRGLELVQNERWDAALAEFLASRELFPTRVAIKNAAISLRQLRRYAESVEMYDEMLRLFGPSIPPEELASIHEAMAQLRKNVGELALNVSPPGSIAIVDGTERGTSPYTKPLLVNAGTHAIRVFHEGFVPFETQLAIAGAQSKTLDVALQPLAQSGRLVVNEPSGGAFKVVVDGAVVGQTPWSGTLEVGPHTVYLRGEGDVGTAPSQATVATGRTTTLTLLTERLDAQVRVEPTPSNARVDIDGVPVGQGLWLGHLRSGGHLIEVSAEGFLAQRLQVDLKPNLPDVLRVVLERDLSDPRWREAFHIYPFVEAVVGGAWAPGFGGSSDAQCNDGNCSERMRPWGFVVGGRGGLQVSRAFAVELFVGYLRLKERSTRKLTNATADYDLTSTDYEDSEQLAGPVAALSGSYKPFERTPATLRLWAGVMRGSSSFSNAGTFSGTATRADAPSVSAPFSDRISVPEVEDRVWVPFVGPEARFGWQLSDAVTLDAGIAFWVMFPPATRRTGQGALDRARGERTSPLPDHLNGFPDGTTLQPGVAALPTEHAFGTFFAILPTIGGRFNL